MIFFDAFLDFVWKCFIENICIYVHKKTCSVILFLLLLGTFVRITDLNHQALVLFLGYFITASILLGVMGLFKLLIRLSVTLISGIDKENYSFS